jgi:hypothetical protein
MMEYYFQRQYFFLFFFLLCSGFLSSSSAYNFTADRKHGWGLNTSENNRWAGEYRFQINDTIGNYFSFFFSCRTFLTWEFLVDLYMLWPGVFLFVCFAVFKGSDSVLVVNETDYDNCNKTNPEKKLDAGDDW